MFAHSVPLCCLQVSKLNQGTLESMPWWQELLGNAEWTPEDLQRCGLGETMERAGAGRPPTAPGTLLSTSELLPLRCWVVIDCSIMEGAGGSPRLLRQG